MHFLLHYTFYLSSRLLLCLESGYRSRGHCFWVLKDNSIVLPAITFSECHCWFRRQLGIDFLNQSRKGSISGVDWGYICWGQRDYFLGWVSKDSEFSTSVGSSHVLITSYVILFLTSTLIVIADTLQGWDLNFCCNSAFLYWGPWFDFPQLVLCLLEKTSFSRAHFEIIRLFMTIRNQFILSLNSLLSFTIFWDGKDQLISSWSSFFSFVSLSRVNQCHHFPNFPQIV